MQRVTLQRPQEHFNQNCSYQITMGHKVLAVLKNGEKKTVEITNEQEDAAIRAKLYWCGSERLKLADIREDEKVVVKGNVFLNRTLPVLGAVFPMTGFIIFDYQNVFAKSIGIGLLTLLSVGLIGTLTLGRNKWLKLRKVTQNKTALELPLEVE